MNLSEYDKVVVTYKNMSQISCICDLRSGHFHDIGQVGKK